MIMKFTYNILLAKKVNIDLVLEKDVANIDYEHLDIYFIFR